MNKKIAVLILVMQHTAIMSFGKDLITAADSGRHDETVITVLNLRPTVLIKNNMMIRLNFDFRQYFRMLNTTSGRMEKLSEKDVLNEMLVNAYIDYGISGNVTIFAQLPLSDTHESTPAGVIAEKGLADIGAGVGYKLFDDRSGKNTITIEGTLYAPTGKSFRLTPSDYPSGMGIIRLKGALTGLHRSENSAFIYSGYYEYRPANASDLNIGDEVGIIVLRQNYFKTIYGNFGVEYGGFSSVKAKDKMAGADLVHTGDFAVDAFAGCWFEYQKNLFLRFGLPYTVYQNGSLFTKYNVLIQLDYRFKF
ncbi:MAG: hypothetical protein WCE64_02720 [Bacteroidales bacterium]